MVDQPPTRAEDHDANRCAYCGAGLDPRYYFCLSCSRPFQQVDSVLTPVPQIEFDDETRIRHEAPQVYRLFAIYLIAIVAGGFLGVLTSPMSNGDLTGHLFLASSLVLGATTLFTSIYYFRVLVHQFRRVGFDRWEAWAGLLLLVPLLGINYTYHHLFFSGVGLEGDGLHYQSLFAHPAGWILFLCVTPAITEEIGFRGLIQEWLEKAISPWKAIALTSALFSVAHFAILSAPYLALAGFLFGWVKWRTGSLYPAMVLHFLHNYAVVAYF